MDSLIWNKIAKNLTRDDVASALRADVNCCIDCMYPDILKKIPKDGFNICIKCVKYILCDRLVIARLNDPSDWLIHTYHDLKRSEYGMFIDDYTTNWFVSDVLTMFTRFAVIDEKIKYTEDCIFCNNQDIVLSTLKSSLFKKQYKQYTKFACKLLNVKDKEYNRHYNNAEYIEEDHYYEDKIKNMVCQRCGFFGCDGDKKCVWYFGEGNINTDIIVKRCTCIKLIPFSNPSKKSSHLKYFDFRQVLYDECEICRNELNNETHSKIKFVNIIYPKNLLDRSYKSPS